MEDDNGIATVYNKDCSQKQSKRSKKAILGEQFEDFTKNTSLHGLRFITEREATIVEKMFWLILFLVSMGVCLYQIRNVWIKWDSSPVIVSINERLVPVSEVPFPSITICPQRKISKHYDYAKQKQKMYGNISEMTDYQRTKFEDISLICHEGNFFKDISKMWLNRNYSDKWLVRNIDEQNGAEPDLIILFLEDRTELDEECNAIYSGYKVYVQHPADVPQSSLYYYAMLPDQTSSFALKYNMVATSDEVKEYTPEKRHCYFPGERYLRYFKIYTENNCRLECLSNYTYNMCGCVGFYMPSNTSNRICTIQSKRCMNSVIEKIAEKETAGISSRLCNCLPACNTVEYDAEVLKTKFDIKHYLLNNKIEASTSHWENYSFSKLEMYFKSPRFMSMRRSELFGLTDFIANCGGLLGLFLGFSFLSLAEIFYYMTLRLWCVFKSDLNKAKQ
ncbi:pickpocket protein 28-like [Manduca sexta]|uniref:pickpocket protein 28-like n=1 Tax=Manduca sexta TaxID=7130 RepID=UPI00188E5DFF|nr:pickpocket protein 28-like [Manduca sexta]